MFESRIIYLHCTIKSFFFPLFCLSVRTYALFYKNVNRMCRNKRSGDSKKIRTVVAYDSELNTCVRQSVKITPRCSIGFLIMAKYTLNPCNDVYTRTAALIGSTDHSWLSLTVKKPIENRT